MVGASQTIESRGYSNPVLTNTLGTSSYIESTICFRTVESFPPEKLT
nr:MAG TPA: hypothetical protein [Caudoviricetes sp.]